MESLSLLKSDPSPLYFILTRTASQQILLARNGVWALSISFLSTFAACTRGVSGHPFLL